MRKVVSIPCTQLLTFLNIRNNSTDVMAKCFFFLPSNQILAARDLSINNMASCMLSNRDPVPNPCNPFESLIKSQQYHIYIYCASSCSTSLIKL